MDYNYKNEQIGGGYAASAFGGQWLWFIILIIFAFLFWNRRDGENHGGGHGGYGCNPFCAPKPMNPAQGCVDTCTIDKDVYKTAYETQKVEIFEADKVKALIEKKFDRLDEREYQKQLTENAELKGQINTMRLLGEIRGDYQKLACEISHLPKGAPCYLETVRACTQGCAPLPCGGGDFRRCDC